MRIDYQNNTKTELYLKFGCVYYDNQSKDFIKKKEKPVADALLKALYAAKKGMVGKNKFFSGIRSLKYYVREEMQQDIEGISFNNLVKKLSPLFLKLNRRGSQDMKLRGIHSYFEVRISNEGEKVVEELIERENKQGGN